MTLVLFLRQTTLDLSSVPPEQLRFLQSSLVFLAVMSWIFLIGTLSIMKPVRTRKWWLGAFINICIGLTTCILTPFCIVLALNWNSKEVQDYFNEASDAVDEAS